jgi:hypothetical protein
LTATNGVLGGLIDRTIGEDDDSYGGKTLHEALYPGHAFGGFRRGEAIAWHRPVRRSTQFGWKKDLLGIARANGVKVSASDSRMWIIWKLWDRRLLPGGVAVPPC